MLVPAIIIPVVVLAAMIVAALYARVQAELDSIIQQVRQRHPEQWELMSRPGALYADLPSLRGRTARPIVAAEFGSTTPDWAESDQALLQSVSRWRELRATSIKASLAIGAIVGTLIFVLRFAT